MKIGQLLIEANAKLLKAVNNDKFYRVGNYYVFITQPTVLQYLLQNGAAGESMFGHWRQSAESGIGILDIQTGEICVGGIENNLGEFEAKWSSSVGNPTAFFKKAGKQDAAKIRNFPARLQYLASAFEVLNAAEEDEKKKDKEITSVGVQRIIDTFRGDDIQGSDYFSIPPEYFDFDTDDVEEAKRQLEDKHRKLKKEIALIEKRVGKLKKIVSDPKLGSKLNRDEIKDLFKQYNALGGGKLSDMQSTEEDLAKFLKVEADLFKSTKDKDVEADDEDIGKDQEAIDTANREVDIWTEDFESDFPTLEFNVNSFFPVE